jgi:DNA polymerase alpha subunit B
LTRKSRGDNRVVFNEQIARVPGLYNAQAKVDIAPLQTVDPYDFFNLNAVERTNCLNAHFQILKERLRKQLNID